ncbi:MAG: hypothetical protein M3Z05_19475 [Gemmatimonadota bacterium]|nr:hypothetical protein [Gemmatimonadota bacterium]
MRTALFVTLAALTSAMPISAQAPIIPPASWQIAAAVTPLPEELKSGATVLGYEAAGKLVTLRAGKNDMICLAPDPAVKNFHSACYHDAMEPFMARGRALRASGVKGPQVDTVRFAEVKKGTLKVPAQPSMLYQIFGGTFDESSGKVTGGSLLYVTYVPYATTASTGITSKPSDKSPWLMFPGNPKAHIMFSVSM